MRAPRPLIVVIALFLVGLFGARVEAQSLGAGVRLSQVTEGTLLWRTAGHDALVPAPVLKTDVDMRVTGLVVRALVRQEFTNPSREWAEGIYVFPLPETAAVDHLRIRVGERTIEGVIRERAAAKATYEQGKKEGKAASLIEQERPNVFTTSVANIAPGASIRVEIEYQQVVRYDEGQFRLRFPMVVGPRYIPGTALGPDQVPDASRITPPVQHPDRGSLNPLSLRIDLTVGVPLAHLEAPHHAIHRTPLTDGGYRITLAEGSVPADRDFELVWQPAAGDAPAAALFTEEREGQVYALLMVMSPARPALDGRRVDREVIFVIDTSGSMAGASIEQAKAAVKLAVARLAPGDAFNVIQFNSWTDGLFGEAQPATAANRALADRYVDRLRANGGTEMLPALVRALDGRSGGHRLRQVVFLTDGQVGNEVQLFAAIQERLGDSRLFTIGIGSAPNSHFMRQAAKHGRGTFTFIGSASEVQAKMEALFRKLEAPALTDVRFELPGVASEILPDPIPDLYLGEPVVVALKTDALPTHAMLRGRYGRVPWQQELFLHEAAEGAGLPVHWAREKIAALLEPRTAGVPEDEVRGAVIAVALEHHLVSPYTSLVAVDVTPLRTGDELLRTHTLKTNLPDGGDYTAVFGLGQGATAGPLHLAIGLAMALPAAAFYIYLRYDVGFARRRRRES